RLHAHAVARDRALGDERVERVVHLVARVHRGRRAVELDEVEPVGAQVAARAVGPLAELREREVVRVLGLAAAHLRRHGDGVAGVVGEERADDLLAATVAVDVRGVEERHARLGRGLEDGERVLLAHVAPVGAELPGSQSDDRDETPRAPEHLSFHRSSSCCVGRVGRRTRAPSLTVGSGSRTLARRVPYVSVNTPAPSGTQVRIAHGEHAATITEVGAAVREYTVGGRPVSTPFREDEVAPAFNGAVLVPWPNRLRDGSYEVDGTTYQVPITEPGRGTALHGLACWQRWTVVEHEAARAALELHLPPSPGYPFDLVVRVTYSLDDAGLRVHVRTTNVGASTAPYGVGFHPWLSA